MTSGTLQKQPNGETRYRAEHVDGPGNENINCNFHYLKSNEIFPVLKDNDVPHRYTRGRQSYYSSQTVSGPFQHTDKQMKSANKFNAQNIDRFGQPAQGGGWGQHAQGGGGGQQAQGGGGGQQAQGGRFGQPAPGGGGQQAQGGGWGQQAQGGGNKFGQQAPRPRNNNAPNRNPGF